MHHAWFFAVALVTVTACDKKPSPAPQAEAVAPAAATAAAPVPAAPTPASPAPAASALPTADPATAPAVPTAPAVAAAPGAPAVAQLGQPAPDFSLTDTEGATWSLSAQRGKIVVIEWFNPGCPFVKYAYNEGPLKDLASAVRGDDVVWVNINSGAPGKQGHGLEVNRAAREAWKIAQPVLIDEDGRVGRLYEARTTPHLYIIDKQGVLAYRGALDNAPLGKVEGDEAPMNYVRAALAEVQAGRPVTTPETVAYGCSVKY